MKTSILLTLLWTFHATASAAAGDDYASMKGLASWYGEAHRGKPMANGQPFNPTRLTAASWFYPLGTRVKVTLDSDPGRSVIVTITDRGPARRLVRQGRVIDLSRAAFEALAPSRLGLITVFLQPASSPGSHLTIIHLKTVNPETLAKANCSIVRCDPGGRGGHFAGAPELLVEDDALIEVYSGFQRAIGMESQRFTIGDAIGEVHPFGKDAVLVPALIPTGDFTVDDGRLGKPFAA